MYTLLSGLYEQYTKKQDYFIVILGLDNAGKTTLLEQVKQIYLNKSLAPERIIPTIGMNMGKIVIGNTRLNFWDLGGQDSLQKLWTKYYEECHGIIFVVDSCDIERIEQVRDTLKTVMTSEQEGVPILMLCNKQDAPQALEVHEIQKVFNEIAQQLEARDSKVLGISALQGTGVKQAVEWMHLRVLANSHSRPPRQQ
ncbi:ADP-ribosylation factor family-domain-containing protein [Gorgonomyces haynaldii]|nr:ADP-ribosylation factor family-domain-containing protein [Gorgonomyces haynaldii]